MFLKNVNMNWKNKIKVLNYRQGLDRFYFVLMFVWFFLMYFTFLSQTLSDKINLYTNDLAGVIFKQVFMFALPFFVYIVLIWVFNVFLWIINGFKDIGSIMPKSKIKIFANENGFFNLVKKHRTLILGIVSILILIGVFISFTFTSYNSYEEKEERQKTLSGLKFNFESIPSIKIPSYIPISER